jgi:hypothetical protein
MTTVVRFFIWALGLLFAVDLVYSAFHQGRVFRVTVEE